MGNQTQTTSGRFGITGKRGGRRMQVAGVARLNVAPFVDGTAPFGNKKSGAQFNSIRNQVRSLWLITGVTKDSAGNPIGSCTVTLFKTADNMPTATQVSDSSGNYAFSIDGNSQARFVVSYKAGAPDVAGTTVNTLIPVLT